MRLWLSRRRVFLVAGLGALTLVVVSVMLVASTRGAQSLSGLIKALAGDGSLRLSDREYTRIVAEIGSCDDVKLLEACILAIEDRTVDLVGPDTRNRVSNIWDGHCLARLVDIGTEEAASVLVRMLDRTDAGGTLCVTIALTEIGRPALTPLREHKGLESTSDLRKELWEAIEKGEVWEL